VATASTLVSLARKLSENEIELLLSTADALSVLNEVYADVLAAYSWPFMQSSTDVTFTSGTKNIGVTRGVVWIEDSEGNRLLQRGPYPQDWRTDRTGAPREFFIEWTMPVTGA
jgi:hypothetical protein